MELVTTVRVVGFDAKVHKKMSRFHSEKEALAVTNCEVKEGKYSSDLEVVVRSSSELTPSPRKFDIPAKLFSTSEDTCPVTVGELTSIANFARVSVKVKVLAEQEPVCIKNGLGAGVWHNHQSSKIR